jgi:hypothetical protein
MMDLNKRAVALMREGFFMDAYTVLHEALEALKNKVSESEPTQDLDSSLEGSLLPVGVRYGAGAETIEKNAFSFYPQAFDFSGSDSELTATSLNDVRMAAVCLYNFGLCFHVQGLGRPSSRQYFAKALQMYATALSLLEATSGHTDNRDQLLKLALYNNVGHIHSCEHKAVEIQDCLEHLRSILESSTERSSQPALQGCDLASTLHGLKYLDFHLNVVILYGTRRHSPAA